jgi:hypothetical protein
MAIISHFADCKIIVNEYPFLYASSPYTISVDGSDYIEIISDPGINIYYSYNGMENVLYNAPILVDCKAPLDLRFEILNPISTTTVILNSQIENKKIIQYTFEVQ